MHTHSLQQWQHDHDFSVIHEHGEKRTAKVLLLTAITMVVEITAGLAFGSMALLADGWHMGTHVAAFAITIFAYRYAKRHARDYCDSGEIKDPDIYERICRKLYTARDDPEAIRLNAQLHDLKNKDLRDEEHR